MNVTEYRDRTANVTEYRDRGDEFPIFECYTGRQKRQSIPAAGIEEDIR